MKKVDWLKNNWLVSALVVILVVGAFFGGKQIGIHDEPYQVTKLLIAHSGNDTLYDLGTGCINMAIYQKTMKHNDKLYLDIWNYFSDLAVSGKLKELTSGNISQK